MKEQKGITLVALVITIIVLLILAGVSISLVVGQNGVLTQATGSVSSNKAASAKQAVSLSIAALETKYYTEWVGNQGRERKDVIVKGDANSGLTKELANQGYTLTMSGTTVVGDANVTLTLKTKTGNDEFKIPVKVNATTGEVTYGQIQIKDRGSFVNVNNI